MSLIIALGNFVNFDSKSSMSLLSKNNVALLYFLNFLLRREEHHTRMTTISEDVDVDSDDEEMEFSTMGNQV